MPGRRLFVRCCAVAVRTRNHRKRDDMLSLVPQTNHATGAGVEQWVV
uniref:Uncharacterized protein n=1 Tax=virus sp. ct6zJ3 TaxID=2826792 RepID=A0A8S5R9B4_9VIRU|nr:MAG TPA: hypothetical protein [virus sp. ct6zJ3]